MGNKTLLIVLFSVFCFVVGGLVGLFRTFLTYPRRYLRITGYGRKLPQKLTGGSFSETYEDNEPQNPDEWERYFNECCGGESDD